MNSGAQKLRERLRSAAPYVLLLLLAIFPYASGLPAEFVYDDHGAIEENLFLQHPHALREILSGKTVMNSAVVDGQRPAVLLSYLLDRAVYGNRAWGFRLTNLLLHAANTVLLFVFLRRWGQPEVGPFAPFCAAALFAVHACNVEAVHAPAYREDLLVTLGGLGFLCSLTLTGARAWLSLPCALLAFASKESSVAIWPLAGWMLLFRPEDKVERFRVAVICMLTGLMAVYFVILWVWAGALQAWGLYSGTYSLEFPTNWFTAPLLWHRTLRWLILPWPLIADHVVEPVPSFASPRFWGPLALLVGWLALVLIARKDRNLSLGLLWVLVAFLPASNIVPLFNPFAERYLYFPSAGFAWIVGLLLGRAKSLERRAAILGVLCAAHVAVIWNRLPDWSNDATLWRRTLAQEPRSARAHIWVGLDQARRGRWDEAQRLLEMAERLNPRDVNAAINLAILYGRRGRLDLAKSRLLQALRQRPDKPEAWWNMAVLLAAEGDEEAARRILALVARRWPYHPLGHQSAQLLTQPPPP